jgi:SNF2-related domain/Helicase conserved C-terminal domain/SWIM zinc finger
MNPLLATADIQVFLDSFPSASRRRGKFYYQDGMVTELACVEPGSIYAAAVLGSQAYGVSFEYDAETHSWSAECNCPVGFQCKHAYAAMLALRANAASLSASAATVSTQLPRKVQPATGTVREAPQPPASALVTALRQALGRSLRADESHYVQQVQALFFQSCNGYSLNTQSLGYLSPGFYASGWETLALWPKPPRDDLQFWLYCAWELRRRSLPVPQFMAPVTDFSPIEPGMRAWERQKAIEHWRQTLQTHQLAFQMESDPVDFRLLIFPDEACVQWKTEAEGKFKRLKQTHLRRFGAACQAGELNLVPEAAPLWAAIHNPYDSFTACHFSYERKETAKMLSQALRLPALADRILTAEERPLARPAEALRYQLQPARDESDDYALNLLLADGSPAPPVLLVVPGQPALYLTATALYPGPVPHGFGVREPLRIPAPALEGAQGVNFLQSLQVDLPPRLAKRVRRVEAVVTVSAGLKPTYLGSRTEAAFLQVTSRVEGGKEETCGSAGWFNPAEYAPPGGGKKKADPNGLIPLVDRSAQRHFPARLESLGAKWDNYQNCWRVTLNKKFPDLFVSWLASLPPEVQVRLEGELATLRDAPLSGSVQLEVEEAGVDWFDLKVALNVADTTLTAEELKLLLNARGGYVRLGKKGWRRLQFDLAPEDDERLARLGLSPRDFTAEPQRLHALQLADEAARKFLPEAQVERLQRRAAELKTRVTPALPAAISAVLRPYQLEGFHFLAYLSANRFGGVLADDMGLGKTLQALTWLAWLRGQPAPSSLSSSSSFSSSNTAPKSEDEEENEHEHEPPPLVLMPSLVICPKSVMDNWRAEAQRFCAGLRVRLWQGEEAGTLEAARAEADLLVLNYAQLRSLSPDIAQHPWQAVILDEAQYIKNPNSQTAQAARALRAEHRLALTGTPIENRLLDLWSIYAFAMPGVLGNRAHFSRSYDRNDDPFARRRLSARVRPFLLRRLKSQVAQDLPDRVEEDLFCEMEREQKTLYRAELKHAQQMLLRVTTQKELNEQRFNFLTSLLRLRQICCHPGLVSDQLKQAESAKVNALHDLLEPILEEGHKVLVFSQFLGLLEYLRQMAKENDWPHFYLAGDTEDRGALVEQFQNAPGSAVFLISLKAGGFGLNLTAASYVVLFDPWWNPAVETQAIDRTHRIGQTSKVMAYRLLIQDSIEQKIRQLQRTKAALAEDVLGEERFAQNLTLDDLRFLFAEE